ncbi:hypothetical protein CRYUN_Cryun03dG0036200 [Craigia yunnanensis]
MWTSMRLHYHMIHNNYLRQQGIQQLFIWHEVWTPQRCAATFGFCLCAVTYSCSCRIDVATEFCHTNWLAKQNDSVKEKSRKAGYENVGVALLTYPVLMASDILLYQSDFVPVGEDQKQHLELTRELAERVNYLYGGSRKSWEALTLIIFYFDHRHGGAIFKVPEPLIPPAGARVMSLSDGLSKMSKSAPSDQSRVNLLDTKDVIANKIKCCKADSFPGLEFDNPERPECNNLLSIYQLISSKTKEEVAQECQDMNWGTFKTLLTDALVDHLHPIQVRYEEIIFEPSYLDGVFAEGATKAAAIADATLNNVYQAM